jgi:hypothetical protein
MRFSQFIQTRIDTILAHREDFARTLSAGRSMTLTAALLAGRSLTQHLALYAQLPHQVGLAGQLAFAVIPWMQSRRSRIAPGH